MCVYLDQIWDARTGFYGAFGYETFRLVMSSGRKVSIFFRFLVRQQLDEACVGVVLG